MLHFDEARTRAIEAVKSQLAHAPPDVRAVLIDDLFGRLRLVLWAVDPNAAKSLEATLQEVLEEAAGPYWTREIWSPQDPKKLSVADRLVYERAWSEASDELPGKLRLLDRHRNRGAWLMPLAEPPWKEPERVSANAPPIVVFYSFKGGVGRSTALAAFAIQRARRGERVAVIDGDLDAPGVGVLLASDRSGTIARWGAVDYLLESRLPEVVLDLRDYYHACRREPVTGEGEILVVPAGQLGPNYVGKLARLDLEPPSRGEGPHPWQTLLGKIRSDLKPQWILLDARAGLGDPAGMLLGGLAHLHVLFGTFSEQSWSGLKLVIDRLGAQRVRDGLPQADCFMVQAMVPDSSEVGPQARLDFAERSRDEFSEHFYAALDESTGSGPDFWDLSDAESSDAPHVPVPITYSQRLADFKGLDDVADSLAEGDFRLLGERIASRFSGRT